MLDASDVCALNAFRELRDAEKKKQKTLQVYASITLDDRAPPSAHARRFLLCKMHADLCTLAALVLLLRNFLNLSCVRNMHELEHSRATKRKSMEVGLR